MINEFEITVKNTKGNKGKSTALQICEDALAKKGYRVLAMGGGKVHTLVIEKEDVLYP